mgnify:CR=1 FL=1
MFDLKILQNYINGGDTPGYNTDELENNPQFMMAAINMANDVNLYRLCSDEVKTNYDFVRFLISKLSKNDNSKRSNLTVYSVANKFMQSKTEEIKRLNKEIDDLEVGILTYIRESSTDKIEKKISELNRINTERLEIAIIVSELLKNDPQYLSEFIAYRSLLASKYNDLKIMIEQIKNELNAKGEEVAVRNLATGFMVVKDKYASSIIVQSYFAKIFIIDILKAKGFNFENYIHENFDSFDRIEEKGFDSYLIEFLGYFDPYLAAYAANHKDVLVDIRKELTTIGKRWDWFVQNNEEKKYDILIDAVLNYWEEEEKKEGFYTDFVAYELLYYIGNELGVLDKILKYDKSGYPYDEIINTILNSEKFKSMSIADIKHYREIKKIMSKILFKKIAEEFDDDGYVEPIKIADDDTKTTVINISEYHGKK